MSEHLKLCCWLYAETGLADGTIAAQPEGKQVHGKGADWIRRRPAKTAQDDATRLTLHDQIHAGIDIVSDGEQRRTSYLTYVTMRLQGFDYETLTKKWTRNNRRLAEVGRCIGPISRIGSILGKDSEFMLSESDRPVKMTLPGPMTVVDSTAENTTAMKKQWLWKSLRL